MLVSPVSVPVLPQVGSEMAIGSRDGVYVSGHTTQQLLVLGIRRSEVERRWTLVRDHQERCSSLYADGA
jgi:hypothetical protein